MRATLSIVAGLVAGVLVAGLVLGGIYVLAPDPVASSSPAPSFAAASPSAAADPSSMPIASVAPSPSVADAPFHVGRPAPVLSVPKVGGGTIDLANLKGKPVWITFMATSCPSCQDDLLLMNELVTRYADDGLVVVAVDVGEEEGAVAAFAERLGARFPLGLDVDGSAARAWDAITPPVHFWVDAEGIVRHGALGGIGPDVLAEGLKSIMPGVDVSL
jgi:peroxiredoxin